MGTRQKKTKGKSLCTRYISMCCVCFTNFYQLNLHIYLITLWFMHILCSMITIDHYTMDIFLRFCTFNGRWKTGQNLTELTFYDFLFFLHTRQALSEYSELMWHTDMNGKKRKNTVGGCYNATLKQFEWRKKIDFLMKFTQFLQWHLSRR